MKKTARFIDRSKEKENLEDEVDEVEAGQLISEGNNLKKILYKCVGDNIGIIPRKDGSEHNKKLVWRVKENSEQLETLANDVAGVVVKLENAIQRKKTEEIQKQRNLPASKLPVWDGNVLAYLDWRQEIEKLAVHPDPTQRMNCIKGQVRYDKACLLYTSPRPRDS